MPADVPSPALDTSFSHFCPELANLEIVTVNQEVQSARTLERLQRLQDSLAAPPFSAVSIPSSNRPFLIILYVGLHNQCSIYTYLVPTPTEVVLCIVL
ncbi:unnamed protein product [Protopolystoma xenopodis]|uniref:Uncharacterized protein n=1 Tax=Protopolystoma xenopodis TaxID=117903 RepID=A0A448WHL6_9PLAT|nr:unnamed protein product [Protopolystoma xenopodis]